jgi:NAD(P)-dependent dehydrogenase (short-subunit alcohol dehydrogenase family)
MMQNLLQDRVVIVVGVGPALGRATALACAGEGARIVLAARSEAKMAEVAEEIAARGGTSLSVPTDMTSPGDCRRLVSEAVQSFGRVDGLVCVAYRHHDNSTITDSPDDLANWRPVMDTNFFGTMQIVKPVIEQMQRQGGGGNIVIINSLNTHNPWPRTLSYTASKAALAAATRSLATEYGPDNIRVNSLHAGVIFNDSLYITIDDIARRNGTTREEEIAKITALSPLRAQTTPEEYTGSILFLLSDMSKPVTGVSLHANAGRYMG